MIRHGIKYMYNEGSIKADYGNALAQHFNEQTHIRTRQDNRTCMHTSITWTLFSDLFFLYT